MGPKNISVGNKLDLVAAAKASNTKEARVYRSQILDIIDNQHIQIATPIEGFKVLLLTVGERFNMTVYAGATLYICQIRITNRYKVKNQYVMDAELISPLRKNQRRAYYRLEYTKDIEYRRLLEDDDESEGQALKIRIFEEDYFFDKGILLDLSGGGCRFVSKEPIAIGERVIVKLPLEESDGGENELSLVAKAVASRIMENQDGVYENRMEFVDIENAKREEIIKFIFERERKNRKNGKS